MEATAVDMDEVVLLQIGIVQQVLDELRRVQDLDRPHAAISEFVSADVCAPQVSADTNRMGWPPGDMINPSWGTTPADRLTTMATYECAVCEMSVNATCGKCDAPLVNDTITRDDGSTVQISKCPNGHGKIKSPMCCGVDMACAVA